MIPALMTVMVVGLGVPTGATPVRADTPSQLEAERAQLLQELAAASSEQSAATAALNNAEDSFNQATSALNTARAQLATLNSELATLNGDITADQTQEAAARNALSTLTRATYESVSGDTVMTAVLNATDFTAAMDSLSGASSITAQIRGLETTLGHDQADLLTKQGQLQNDFAQATALEGQLSTQSSQLLSIVYARDQVLEQFTGPAQQLAEQIDEIDNELGGTAAVPSSTSCSDSFAYGDCTWYVATRRCIPWGGNANAWYYNASKMGYQEGSVPEVGAVAVWDQGQGGANAWYGHVAYVEVVGPDLGVGSIPVVPAGDFEISEMNWGDWDQVDYRLLPDTATYFQGFIYGPG
ncbi:MAG: CHAP domain-containing protein [Candidatus Dormibacteria bacterium]